jgi:ssDNA-binding Zn-finger/Zn-ribbon topoisomerase 1
MQIAQKLYEAGHITYMRTDSTNLSAQAQNQILAYVDKKYGKEYTEGRIYKTKSKNAQEAHEAIRPTHIEVEHAGTEEQQKLYRLIWERTVSSQMTDAKLSKTKISAVIEDDKSLPPFSANGSRLLFPGWLKVDSDARGDDVELPKCAVGEKLKLLDLESQEKFTEPPGRYSEAGLVKELEARGIGRPSTYASIMRTIEERGYVKKENKTLFPTDTGEVVSDFLEKNFAEYISDTFTAEMEDELDEISRGEREYEKTLKDFYTPFLKEVKEKDKLAKATDLGDAPENIKCPKCGKKMIIKLARAGKFYSCSDYPDCTGALMLDGTELQGPKEIGELCPICGEKKGKSGGGKLVIRERRDGTGTFISCSRYPKCKFIKEDEEEKKVYQALQSERLTQVDRLKKSTTQKFSKSVVFVENERRDLEEASSDIFKALFYLDVNENTNEYPNYEDLNSISPKEFENSVILPEQATKRAIEGFADRLKLDPEVVALYVEDILREVVGHNDMSVLRSIMDFISSSPTQEDIFKLKGQDKKMHNFLKYRLLPLVSLMSKEEISYLQELAGSTDSPFEFIVELGDIISEQFDAMQGDENADKMVKELRAFSMRFMNKNKDDFIIKAMGIFISKSKTVKQEEYSLDPEIEAVYQDAEEIEEELKRINIANWNVKLSDGYHLETGREQVVGTTLEEYEESIDALFQKSGRAISIKTSSMVRALDWFLGIPEEFLRIWPKEEVDGVEYYKVKRGAVRIFCHLDRNNQEMTFFPYQKDDMAYHFRS